MEWIAPVLIVGAVVLSVPILIRYTQRRDWNVDRAADARREEE